MSLLRRPKRTAPTVERLITDLYNAQVPLVKPGPPEVIPSWFAFADELAQTQTDLDWDELISDVEFLGLGESHWSHSPSDFIAANAYRMRRAGIEVFLFEFELEAGRLLLEALNERGYISPQDKEFQIARELIRDDVDITPTINMLNTLHRAGFKLFVIDSNLGPCAQRDVDMATAVDGILEQWPPGGDGKARVAGKFGEFHVGKIPVTKYTPMMELLRNNFLRVTRSAVITGGTRVPFQALRASSWIGGFHDKTAVLNPQSVKGHLWGNLYEPDLFIHLRQSVSAGHDSVHIHSASQATVLNQDSQPHWVRAARAGEPGALMGLGAQLMNDGEYRAAALVLNATYRLGEPEALAHLVRAVEACTEVMKFPPVAGVIGRGGHSFGV